MSRTITQIDCRWDDQPGVTPGWYCECQDEDGQCVIDSVKVDFPFDVDDYDQDSAEELTAALAKEFPGVEITVR